MNTRLQLLAAWHGYLGFSYIGLLFLLLLIVPNLIWTKKMPQGYSAAKENKLLLFLERAGEVLVSCTVLIFKDFNLKGKACFWSLWLVAAACCMVLYELWWIRYFRSERTLNDFYSSFLKIPVAGATLPVIAFFLLGIYGRVIWLLLAVILLGIGHIGIHLQHAKAI